jgi:hypothetical protein
MYTNDFSDNYTVYFASRTTVAFGANQTTLYLAANDQMLTDCHYQVMNLILSTSHTFFTVKDCYCVDVIYNSNQIYFIT